MKRPEIMKVRPSESKLDEGGGMWFYLPAWIARAYRLKNSYPFLNGKVIFEIRDKPRCLKDIYRQIRLKQTHQYFKENWSKKLLHEERKKRMEAKP